MNLEEVKKERLAGIKADLASYGIKDVKEVVYNPTYEELFEQETLPTLEGFEKGAVTELGAVDVMTGVYTGRSPKDKFIVLDDKSKDTVWWTTEEYKNDNKPASQEAWKALQRARYRRTLRQETLCCRRLLRCQQGHPHGCALHHGSCLAGSLREEHVHPPQR